MGKKKPGQGRPGTRPEESSFLLEGRKPDNMDSAVGVNNGHLAAQVAADSGLNSVLGQRFTTGRGSVTEYGTGFRSRPVATGIHRATDCDRAAGQRGTRSFRPEVSRFLLRRLIQFFLNGPQ